MNGLGGQRADRAELINSKGITATNTTTVTVCSSEQARPKE
ncbi:hypothetical protein OHO28_08525 [Streptomyces europaeiscabiei]